MRALALRYGLLLIPLLFLALFFFYPLLRIFDYSFGLSQSSGFEEFLRVATTPYYRGTVLFTVFQATLSTLLTLGLALPCAYVFVRYDFWGKRLLLASATLSFVLPTVVVAIAFTLLLGRQGVLNQALMGLLRSTAPPIQLERTLGMILVVHVFYNFAIALRVIVSYWLNVSPHLEEAARLLGVGGWRLWWQVRLPLLRPALVSAGLLVFTFTFTSFGVVLILGGVRFATLEVQIYYQALTVFDLPMASALAVVQLAMIGALTAVYTRTQRRLALDWRAARDVARVPHTWGAKLAVASVLLLVVLLLFMPLFVLVWQSLTWRQDGISLSYYAGLLVNERRSLLFVPPVVAIGNSFVFALLTTGLSVSLGGILAYWVYAFSGRAARLVEFLAILPLAVSAVVLGFGFLLGLDTPPLALRTWWGLVPIAHTLVALPLVLRVLLPALRRLPPSWVVAARLLGAGRWRVLWTIELPLIWRSVLVSAVFAFTTSMGEFGASLFVVRPDTPTLPLVIYRLISQPNPQYYGQALAMSVILLVICALAFITIERLRPVGSASEL